MPRWQADGYRITRADIEEALRLQKVKLETGDVVLLPPTAFPLD